MLEAYRDEWKAFSKPYQEKFNEEVNVLLGVSEDDKYVVDVVTGGTSNKILGFLIQDLTGSEDEDDEMGFIQYMRDLGEITGKPMSKINLDDLVETLHEADEYVLPDGSTFATLYSQDGTISTDLTCVVVHHTSNVDAQLVFGEYYPPACEFLGKNKKVF